MKGLGMIVSGKRAPNYIASRLYHLRFALAQGLGMRIEVREGDTSYRFDCRSYTEFKRAVTLFQKEEGTIKWLRDTLRPGDTFCDIGANVGLYSVVAGGLVGEAGQVQSFEPHPANVMSLMQNIQINGLTERAKVISAALGDSNGFFDFNIREAVSGSSMSQLGRTVDGNDKAFVPVLRECKAAFTLDHLVAEGIVRAPDVIKIDVDGNELLILAGMAQVLGSDTPPRSVQVEVNHRYEAELDAIMQGHGYRLTDRHHTFIGKRKIAKRADPMSVAHNAVYGRAA
jgi:FkbM family methyltransferase